MLLGFDPSTKGAAWALLRIEPRLREHIAAGWCKSEEDILTLLRAQAAEHPDPDLIVAIETPTTLHVHSLRGDMGKTIGRARALMGTSATATFIRAHAQAMNLTVAALTPREARTQVGLRETSSDRAVADCLRVLVRNWPKRSNEHVRDAAVVALAAALRAR